MLQKYLVLVSVVIREYKIWFLIGALSLLGCEKAPDFSEVPEIEFVELRSTVFDSGTAQVRDSMTIIIDFQDGDGDLGITADMVDQDSRYWTDTVVQEADTVINPVTMDTIYFAEEISYEHRNFQLKIYKRNNGVFEEVETPITQGGLIEPLQDVSFIGPIEGTLNFGFTWFKGTSNIFEIGDTVRFEVSLLDRELNKSNVINTSEHYLFLE